METLIKNLNTLFMIYQTALLYGFCIGSIIIVLLGTETFKKKYYDKYLTGEYIKKEKVKAFFKNHKTLVILLFSLMASILLTLIELLLFGSFRLIAWIAAVFLCWCISGQSSSILKIFYALLKKKGIDLEQD